MPAKVLKAGERIGIFALDPGRTTGVAITTPLLKGSSEEIFRRDPIEAWQVDCNNQRIHPTQAEIDGSKQIADDFLAIAAEWTIAGLKPRNQYLVFEDFVLNRNPRSYDREGISPARVMSTIFGCLVQHHVQYVPQQASMAKQRWSMDRMRRAGIWLPGLDHANDASRHAALFVVSQMG